MILVPHVDTGGRDMETFIKDIVANTPKTIPLHRMKNIRKDGRIVQVIWTNKAIYIPMDKLKKYWQLVMTSPNSRELKMH